jgi:hypothetical protein
MDHENASNSLDWLSSVSTRLHIAIDCPQTLSGAAVAARSLLKFVKNANRFYPDSVGQDWLTAVVQHAQHLGSQSATNISLSQVSKQLTQEKIYGPFVTSGKHSLLTTNMERLAGAMGLVLVYCAAAARPISTGAMAAYTRLLRCGDPRSGRHPDWQEFSNNIPRSLDEIEVWKKKTEQKDLQHLLSAMASALANPILSPQAIAQPQTIRQSSEHRSSSESSSGSNTHPQGEKGRKRGAHRLTPTPDSLVGWLIQRANQTEFTGHFGLNDRWEVQTREELQYVCKKILAVLTENNGEQAFAFFAVICLTSALPADLAINIKLHPSTDLWYPAEKGMLRWCTLRATNPELAKKLKPDDISDAQILDICLPQAAADVGATFYKFRPNARTVVELLTGSTSDASKVQFIDEYREWLTALGAESLHKVYDARWARGIGQIYREISTDVAAALLGLNFEECALGMLAYVRISTAWAHALTTTVYNILGLGPAVPVEAQSRHVGSEGALDLEPFFQGLVRLWAERDRLIEELKHAQTPDEAAAVFTKIVEISCFSYVTVSMGRGHHLERITHGTARSNNHLVLLEDKDISDATNCRAFPLHSVLRSILQSHIDITSTFCAKLVSFGVHLGKKFGRQFDDSAPHRVLFSSPKLIAETEYNYITREPINRKHLNDLSVTYFNGYLNVGRHTLISASVQNHVDPWLTKTLSGHFRGQADPFADGMFIPPAHAIQLAKHALEWLFREIPDRYRLKKYRTATALPKIEGRLPPPAVDSHRSSQSRTRVLAPAFDHHTFLSLRVVDQLRQIAAIGEGPTHPGSNLLLNLVVINWILLPDVRTLWHSKQPFTLLTQECSAATWSRSECRAEIRRNLEYTTASALQENGAKDLPENWTTACLQLLVWLRGCFPNLRWPDDPESTLATLSSMTSRWLRFKVPPFVLTAGSPKLTAPTIDASSLARLADVNETHNISPDEVLVLPPPKPRATGNFKPQKTKMQEAIDIVQKYARRAARDVESISSQIDADAGLNLARDEDDIRPDASDWERMRRIRRALGHLNPQDHLPAATFKLVMTYEAKLWQASKGDRVETSSLRTYTSNLKQGLLILRPTDDMVLWGEEWYEWLHFLKTTAPGETSEERSQSFERRVTAAKRFVKILRIHDYPVPLDLFDSTVESKDGLRRSATSTILLKRDQASVERLMANHFQRFRVESQLAKIYAALHWAIAARATEFGALQLNCLDEFRRFIIALDYFSMLKSEHARRISPLSTALAENFDSLSQVVRAAYPRAKYLFLFDNPADWRFVDQLEAALSQALKQVTQSALARPHLTRLVSSLDYLLPGWEEILRKLVNGSATTAECARFGASLRKLGFTHLIAVLLRIAHGHPVTFLKYYFSVWDLVLSLYCHASLAEIECPKLFIKNRQPHLKDAFRKASALAGKDFDGSQWIVRKSVKSLELPALDVPLHPARKVIQKSLPSNGAPLTGKFDVLLYTATRLVGFDKDAASLKFSIDTSSEARAESLICRVDCDAFTKGHQSPPSPRGKDAMHKYLVGTEGASLIKSLRSTPQELMDQLGESLAEKRTYGHQLPPVDELVIWLLSLLKCLPAQLGLMIQVGKDLLTSADVIRVENCSPQIFVGPSDRDLGGRPRLSVVDVKDPTNLVKRPRLTGATRCAVKAIQLHKFF